MNKLRLHILGLLMLFLLSACNDFPPNHISLEIITVSPEGPTPATCTQGIQAKLTILSDQTVLETPLVPPGESFFIASEKNYLDTRVRIEAFCYEANNVVGKIIVERNTGLGSFKSGAKGEEIYFGGYEPFGEYCISKDWQTYNPASGITLIEAVEPLPCIAW